MSHTADYLLVSLHRYTVHSWELQDAAKAGMEGLSACTSTCNTGALVERAEEGFNGAFSQ